MRADVDKIDISREKIIIHKLNDCAKSLFTTPFAKCDREASSFSRVSRKIIRMKSLHCDVPFLKPFIFFFLQKAIIVFNIVICGNWILP